MPAYDDEAFDRDDDDEDPEDRIEREKREDAELDREIDEILFQLYLTFEERLKVDKNNPQAMTSAVALARQRYKAAERQKDMQKASENAQASVPPPTDEELLNFPKEDIPPAFQDAPRCQHVKANNQPCGSPAMKSRRYCYFHDQSRARSKKQIRLPVLEDHRAIQMAITRICQGITDQAIDAKVGSTLLYGLQVASTAVPRMVAKKSSRKER